jgi:membrane-associated phospholipid phosphatase
MSGARDSSLTPRAALLGALLCLCGFALTGAVALLVPAAHARDALALHAFNQLDGTHVSSLAARVIRLLSPPFSATLGAAIVGCAIARGRLRLALAIAIVLSASIASADVLKPLLGARHTGDVIGRTLIPDASWPSGHSTAAMALALCAIMAVPRRMRPLVGLVGCVFAIGVGYSLLTLDRHLPSDVVGGYLLAATWALGAFAAVRASEARWPAGTARASLTARARTRSLAPAVPLALLAAVLGACGLAGVASLHGQGLEGLLLVSGATIAGLAATLIGGLTVAMRR